MIIFGTRGVKSTIKSGVFNCPQCDLSKQFRHRKVTKFFTLYFIPLIPLGSNGEYVECTCCKGTFIPRVLDNQGANKSEIEAIYEKAIRHSMVLIMLADGIIEEEEKQQVLLVINKFSKKSVNMEQLEAYIQKVQNDNEDITTYLKKITSSLNEHGKEIIIKCAISVAAADGNIDQSELELIQKMSQAMEMSASHLKGILAELTSFSNN
jgi:uncharacterized tellurite resistance protein B-like protein